MRFILRVILVLGLALPMYAATYTVDVGPGMSFNPAFLSVSPGDTVTWNFLAPNHTTTSNATTGPDAWNSGVRNPGETFSHTFAVNGTFPYYCAVHSFAGGTMMNGLIFVGPPLPPVVTSVNPTSGNVAGGLNVTVSGVRFTGNCMVSFGGVAAPSTTVVSSTTLQTITPAHAAGTVSVRVACTNGTSTLPAAFEYETAAAAAPAVPTASLPMLILLGIALVAVAFVVMRRVV